MRPGAEAKAGMTDRQAVIASASGGLGGDIALRHSDDEAGA